MHFSMQRPDIAALGMLFFKDSCRGGREPRKKLALVVEPLLDRRYLSCLGLYRCHILLERLLSSFKRPLSGRKTLLPLLQSLDISLYIFKYFQHLLIGTHSSYRSIA